MGIPCTVYNFIVFRVSYRMQPYSPSLREGGRKEGRNKGRETAMLSSLNPTSLSLSLSLTFHEKEGITRPNEPNCKRNIILASGKAATL